MCVRYVVSEMKTNLRQVTNSRSLLMSIVPRVMAVSETMSRKAKEIPSVRRCLYCGGPHRNENKAFCSSECCREWKLKSKGRM